MKKKYLKCFLFLVVAFSFFYVSCSLESLLKGAPPEFAIENLNYKQALEEYELPCGVYFDFCNKSQKKVMFVEARTNIYDKKTGQPAFITNPTVTCSFDGFIESMKTKQLCIPLDQYGAAVGGMELYIDSFYISRIIYSDGTSWLDLFGAYSITGGEGL